MQSSTEFKPDESFCLLLQGPPKTGKTCLTMQFPIPWFMEADKNLQSAVSMFPGKEFYFDYPNIDHKGNEITKAELVWDNLVSQVKAACITPNIRTIVIDSLTPIDTILQDHLVAKGGTGATLRIGGVAVMDQSLWNPYKWLMVRFIELLKKSGKMVIVIAHERTREDKKTGMVDLLPNIGGQLRDTLPYLFTDIWRTEAVVVGKDVRYRLRTAPTSRVNYLTSSCGLPADWTFSWPELETALAKKANPTKA